MRWNLACAWVLMLAAVAPSAWAAGDDLVRNDAYYRDRIAFLELDADMAAKVQHKVQAKNAALKAFDARPGATREQREILEDELEQGIMTLLSPDEQAMWYAQDFYDTGMGIATRKGVHVSAARKKWKIIVVSDGAGKKKAGAKTKKERDQATEQFGEQFNELLKILLEEAKKSTKKHA